MSEYEEALAEALRLTEAEAFEEAWRTGALLDANRLYAVALNAVAAAESEQALAEVPELVWTG